MAGSERIAKSHAKGQTLDEARKINLSLTELGRCIKELIEGKSHVPYRNSRLTFFLKESLGGNSVTTLICTISRQHRHYEESVQTMHFAARAKKIKNKVVSNIILSPQELEKQVALFKKEVHVLMK